jgi:hypothetical protein
LVAFVALGAATGAATTTGAATSTEATVATAFVADFFVVVFAAALILVLSEELIADMERGYLCRDCDTTLSTLVAKP